MAPLDADGAEGPPPNGDGVAPKGEAAAEAPKGELVAVAPKGEAAVEEPKGEADALDPKGDAEADEPKRAEALVPKGDAEALGPKGDAAVPVAADAPKRPEPLLTPKVEFEAEKADPAAAVVVVNGLPDGSLVAAAEEAKGEPPELELEPVLEPNRELLVVALANGLALPPPPKAEPVPTAEVCVTAVVPNGVLTTAVPVSGAAAPIAAKGFAVEAGAVADSFEKDAGDPEEGPEAVAENAGTLAAPKGDVVGGPDAWTAAAAFGAVGAREGPSGFAFSLLAAAHSPVLAAGAPRLNAPNADLGGEVRVSTWMCGWRGSAALGVPMAVLELSDGG